MNARIALLAAAILDGLPVQSPPRVAQPLDLNSMKSTLSFIFALFLALSLFGCASNSKQRTTNPGGAGGASQNGDNTGGGGGVPNTADTHWVGTWATAPMLIGSDHLPPEPGLSGNTLRQVILTSVGGEGFRLQLSNAFGSSDLVLEAVHVANSTDADAIDPATDASLTFDGQASVTIPAGEAVYSDPIDRPLAATTKLAVTIHFGAVPDDLTGHPGSRTTSYLVSGDATADASLPTAVTADRWYVISALDVLAPLSAASVVILGDSITDGYGTTTNANNRWPDVFSQRLRANDATRDVGVLNLGIGGNAILSGGLGPTARQRFERDVIEQSGAKWLIVFIGVNDIGASSGTGIADQLTSSYEEFISVAHANGMLVYGATITPIVGSQYDSEDRETVRQTVNEWIRTSSSFDAVIDLDAAIRDPDSPTELLSTYDSGDHLHPSVAGYEALAEAVDLNLFADSSAVVPGAGGAGSIGGGYPCANSTPPSAAINDFSTWSSGNWGDTSTLQGGTFYYDGDGDDAVQALSIDVTDDLATVSGEVSGGYAGFGFWLASCVDASEYAGISFTIGGDLNDAEIEFQIQTSRNYPIDDTNSKGECEGSWSDCTNNKIALDIPDTATADAPITVEVRWEELTGGTPISTMDPTELLGLQWQLNCSDCTPTFVLDDVQFLAAE